jgi:hypothetical protein
MDQPKSDITPGMPDRLDIEHLALRQADQARTDFAAIEDHLDFIVSQLALLPSRQQLTQRLLLAMLGTAALTTVLELALIR